MGLHGSESAREALEGGQREDQGRRTRVGLASHVDLREGQAGVGARLPHRGQGHAARGGHERGHTARGVSLTTTVTGASHTEQRVFPAEGTHDMAVSSARAS